MRSDFDTAIGMVQMLLQNERSGVALTREEMASAVDRILIVNTKWQETVGRDRLIAELESRFSVWIGREATLSDDDDHRPWLFAARSEGWQYWPRYRAWLESSMPAPSIDALDTATSRVLGLLEDPERDGAWHRRGLVVGHVQSGKTANYTGMICKAADAGYKLIIVLAGLHNNLRSQTQMRLDEGFLGYESLPPREAEVRELKLIGVGEVDPRPRPDYVTNRSERGDFNRAVANKFGINPGGRPLLFVVKKNAAVLKNLVGWVNWAANSRDVKSGRPLVIDVPLLVIDDEADHASVDTGEQSFDETGKPDEEHDPTRINGLIRKILFAFEKSAYVGYTATPFANIFIHDKGRTVEHGDDLFPRSFIVNLPAPSNYAGPVRIFGLEPQDDNLPENEPLPLVHLISDHAASEALNERDGWMPPRHRNGHRPLYQGKPEVPPSLSLAVQSFILSCAARMARGQTAQHNSMLIHVTRFTNVQHEVRRQVEEELQRMVRRLRHGEGAASDTVLASLRELWEGDFVPTTEIVADETGDLGITSLRWTEIEALLPQVAADITVREINGSAGDVLDYEIYRESGLKVIAIGGEKLSRGLTLEGLTVSYFLRATRMYDTLMQMGRWFGYKEGYLDLCRLYSTADLKAWFEHITEASEELRQEFDHMVAVGGTPRQYGLKVRSHPALLVTSRVKMRNGTEMRLSYAGSVSETTVFHRDKQTIARNFEVVEKLVKELGSPNEVDVERERPGSTTHLWKGSRLWVNVPSEKVVALLDGVTTHEDALKANSRLLRDYIDTQTKQGELVDWAIALMTGEGGKAQIAGQTINLVKRSPKTTDEERESTGRYIIRRLLSPRDEAIDIDQNDYKMALEQTIDAWQRDRGRSRRSKNEPTSPSGPSIRERRPATRGLLLIYPLSPEGDHVEGDVPVIGFGMSFPASDSARSVTYRVNNVYWSQEFEDTL